MDTKRMNPNGQTKTRGGKDNTKIILTATGVASAVAGAAAGHIFSGKENESEPDKETAHEEQVAQNEEKQPVEENQQSSSTTESHTSANGDNVSEPQPTTGNGGQNGTAQEPTHPTGGEGAQQVAEQIAHAEEIDRNDIDAPSVVEIDGLTYAYDADGNQVPAAEVHTPDGTPFLLVDIDGDGVYESVFDSSGNYVAHAEANLTHSDLEAMMDQTGGYLALTDQDVHTMSEDPTNDIIDTETGTHPDMAMNETSTEEPIEYSGEMEPDDVDNLLAELLGGADENGSKGMEEVLVDESEVLEPESEDEDLDDDDSDDDDWDDTMDDDE